ncbi:hypothetical protein [Lactiplantibacillus argentoratensis]|uniref:Uncharacterized protein n=1 Tax=Lactiplantibacillus argentoratensis TaxID=271881 RepID=A0ABS5UGI8_9LACO|nr:hypothetical protein [Lactiplantibacillus argentoratensis]MBT1137692.1 hypothetical protein [Lactiplantibacillus argentoratensis]MBT1140550.1 hypothetical protein [Lactiplantibacillus argentoratensis]
MKKIIQKILENSLSSLLCTAIIWLCSNAAVFYMFIPNKSIIQSFSIIYDNKIWMTIIIIGLLLLIARSYNIHRINKIQYFPDYSLIPQTRSTITVKKPGEVAFTVYLSYSFDNRIFVQGISNLRCPKCAQDLVTKRTIILGRYEHFCPQCKFSITNNFTDNTWSQILTRNSETLFNNKTTEQVNDVIKQ